MAREVRRININIPVNTLEKIDEYADKMSINRTAAILVLINLSLDNQRAINTLEELMIAYKDDAIKKGLSVIPTK